MSDTRRAHPLRAVYNFFRSLRLAVALILVLTALSVIATFIPQGQEPAFYQARYPTFGSSIVVLGFDRMFTSFLFLLPAGLFFVNLLVCTIHRFTARLQSGAKRRYGPDILHVGLLMLMAGALVTFYGRTEQMVHLHVGQSVEVPGGYVLTLDDFIFERYESGAPKDWLSIVTVTRDGEIVEDRRVIEVNAALRLGAVKLYQSSYGLDEGVVITDLSGTKYWVGPGRIIPVGDDDGLVLAEISTGPGGDENAAVFDIWEGHEVTGRQTLTAGAMVGQWVIAEVVSDYVTGLELVRDPGYLPVLIALIILTIGLFLTYIQKLGDHKV